MRKGATTSGMAGDSGSVGDWAEYWTALFNALVVILLVAASNLPARGEPPAGDRWIKLSDLPVGSGLETETIRVGRDSGPIERIKVATTGTDILVQELRIYYADGEMQRSMRQERLGAQSAPATTVLDGQGKPVDYIEITFKGAGFGRRGARLELWAEPAGLTSATVGSDDVAWTVLGQQDVGRSVGHAVIPVGRRAGRFAAIQLVVSNSDVAFHDVRVVYVDGESDVLAVRRLIRAGDQSPLLPLVGGPRIIREIALVHEADPKAPETATVQVLGWRSMDERQASAANQPGNSGRQQR